MSKRIENRLVMIDDETEAEKLISCTVIAPGMFGMEYQTNYFTVCKMFKAGKSDDEIEEELQISPRALSSIKNYLAKKAIKKLLEAGKTDNEIEKEGFDVTLIDGAKKEFRQDNLIRNFLRQQTANVAADRVDDVAAAAAPAASSAAALTAGQPPTAGLCQYKYVMEMLRNGVSEQEILKAGYSPRTIQRAKQELKKEKDGAGKAGKTSKKRRSPAGK